MRLFEGAFDKLDFAVSNHSSPSNAGSSKFGGPAGPLPAGPGSPLGPGDHFSPRWMRMRSYVLRRGLNWSAWTKFCWRWRWFLVLTLSQASLSTSWWTRPQQRCVLLRGCSWSSLAEAWSILNEKARSCGVSGEMEERSEAEGTWSYSHFRHVT